MYRYIIGIVTEQDSNNITLECNNVGYQVFVSNPYSYELNNEYKVYLYNHIREDENSLYGFKTKEELELFLKLIGVKGLGPKTAIGILAGGKASGVIDAIERENILYLQKFPKVGEKLARQIILDLRGKLVTGTEKNEVNNELVEALVSLGYKKQDISKITKEIDKSLSIENQIKEALKLLFR